VLCKSNEKDLKAKNEIEAKGSYALEKGKLGRISEE
jgi:hypothetical protein